MTTALPSYSWLPAPPLRNFDWFPGEERALAMKEPLPHGAADWAERHRIIQVSSVPGPYRHENAPYFWFPLHCYSLPWVREIRVAAGSQLGKTEFAYNTHGYDVDYDPGPSLFVMPSRDTAKDVSLDRIQPMYDDCAPLRAIKSRNPDDTSTTRIKTRNGVTTYFGWAGSDAILSNKPIKYGKIDEADLVGRRSINLARARLRTYSYEYKLVIVSKPSVEDGPIWEDLNSSHVIYDYHVPCPLCGHEQTMVFGQYRWTEGVTDPKRIEMTRDAWYECEACGGHWDEALRDIAVRNAMHDGWKPRRFCTACHDVQLRDGVCPRCGGTEAAPLPEHPEVIGFHLPAFYSRFVRHSDIVADYLRYQQDPHAKDGDAPSNAEKFWCDDCGLPLPASAEGETLDEQHLYDRREEYAPKGAVWEVPMAACMLTAAVDVQGNRLEIEIEAWGQKRENWGILKDVITGSPAREETWAELEEKYLHRTFLHESGIALRIAGMGIDTGGHHTDMAYRFAKKHRRRRVYALKGWHIPGKPLKGKPSTNNAYKVPLYMIGTETAKDSIFEWLTAEEPGPYYQHFPRTYDFEFFRQLVSEEPAFKRDTGGRLVKYYRIRKGYHRNEGLDLKGYNLAVYAILNPNMEKLARDLREQAAELAIPLTAEEPFGIVEKLKEKLRPHLEKLTEDRRAAAEERIESLGDKLQEAAAGMTAASAPLARKKKKIVKKRRSGFASKLRG